MSSNHFTSPSPPPHPFSEPRIVDSQRAALAAGLRNDRRDSILLGESIAVRRLCSQIQRIAPYFRTALIRGETGSGKQLVARAIHALSPRADGPFIVANASAVAESFAGDEASPSRRTPAAEALVDSADGGTLYLDGIGELPFTLQAALLRFLRASEDRRAAASRPSRTGLGRPDARILAASDRDLRTLAAVGQFRQDLYARLSVVEFFVPPLRQRVEDIPSLAEWMLRRLSGQTGQSQKLLAEATLAQLQNRPWPNNFRELEQVVAQAAALAEGTVVEPRHLLALVEPVSANLAPPTVKIERLHDVIQQHVLDVLTRSGGNKLRAAELLGISRSTLYRMLDASSTTARGLPE